MQKIITNTNVVIIAIISLIIGTLWAVKTQWDYEPILLIAISTMELITFSILKFITAVKDNSEAELLTIPVKANETIEQKVSVNVTIGKNEIEGLEKTIEDPKQGLPREEIINIMKNKVQILFIDDDKKFNVVKNLKDGGWRLTKTVEDIKNVDVPIVKASYILFVDINGVGKALNLEYEGLDLALMLKQRYPEKKVIIYSANKNSYSFHKAWTSCDYRLEKNALPYQFQSLVESYSIELFKKDL